MALVDQMQGGILHQIIITVHILEVYNSLQSIILSIINLTLASVNLVISEKNSASILINCPGDTIIYSCGIQSNSEMIHLTWHVTFPGYMPINYTFYDDMSPANYNLDMNTSINLTQYEEDEYIESEITLTVLKNVTLNGTVLECSIGPNLDRDTIIVLLNASGY